MEWCDVKYHTPIVNILMQGRNHKFGSLSMLSLDERSRKRSCRDLTLSAVPNDGDRTQRHKTNDSATPVICMSGLATEEKEKYHGIIESLGGR